MKKLYLTIIPFLFALTLSADSVTEITEKHMGAMLSELKTYIAENPEASDVDEAYQFGIQAAYVTGQNEEVIGLLTTQFKALAADENAEEQTIIQTGMMLAQFSQQVGNQDAVLMVKETFEDRAKENPNSAYTQVSQALSGMVNQIGVGDTPELTATTLDGEKISLEDFRGKVVLIDFWATWCPPCVEGLPEIKKAYEAYKDKGFEIIGISLDQGLEPLENFIEEEELGWINVFDADQETSLADQFNVSSIPSLYLVDQEGKIVALNPRGEGVLEGELAKLLGDG